jgi:hypothetical protein
MFTIPKVHTFLYVATSMSLVGAGFLSVLGEAEVLYLSEYSVWEFLHESKMKDVYFGVFVLSHGVNEAHATRYLSPS